MNKFYNVLTLKLGSRFRFLFESSRVLNYVNIE